MGFFSSKHRPHLKVVEDIAVTRTGEVILPAPAPTLNDLKATLDQAQSHVVHCQCELAKAQQLCEDAGIALLTAVHAINFPEASLTKFKGRKP